MADVTTSLVAAKALTITFGGVDVLKGVDLDLHAGEVHALAGENGAGKSSLAKAIAGVYKPRQGQILLEGRPICFSSPREAIHHGIALIHQEPQTFPDLDVAENIFAAHHPKRGGVVDWSSVYTKASEILDSLGVKLDPQAKVGGLSVAKQQMVELACAMSHKARVWIFDETTAPLTPKEIEELFVVMRRLREQGCALAMVTHHLDEIFEISDRITVLRDGQKVGERTPAESSVPEVIQMMVGRELASESLHATQPRAENPRLCVQGLSGHGFKDVSFDLHPGEVVGFVGLVGAGRTELAQALFGIRPHSGTILLDGKRANLSSPRNAISNGIALVPEDRQHDGLLSFQSIGFNATLAWLSRLCRFGWLNQKKIKAQTVDFGKRLKLAYRGAEQPISELSGGNQQKVVLSRWLMTDAKVLILDEPTRGVDVGAKHEVHKLIREQADQGMAVMMISSDLPEALALSDRILVMREGRIAAELPGKTATQPQIMAAATGQEAAFEA